MAFHERQPAEYHSYLLRLWRNGPQQPWRASMQCTATGEFHQFAALEYLFHFLQAQAPQDEAPATPAPE